MGENKCIMCGNVIPEGRMVCPNCEKIDVDTKESSFIETIINIATVDKVKEFCNLCSKCTDDVLVYSGRYIVSGKSIMGLFSLNLAKPLKVEFYGDIPYEVKEGMNKFIAN